MKILHIAHSMIRGSGISVFVGEVAREQAVLGHDVRVWCWGGMEYPTGTARCELRPKLPRRIEADWAHVHGLWSRYCAKAMWLCWRSGVPFVFSPHGGLMPRVFTKGRVKKFLVWNLLLKPLVKRAALIHCTSEAEADACRARGMKGPFVVAPLGVRERRSEKCEVRSEKLGAGERSEKCEVRSEKLGAGERSEKCEVRSEKLGTGVLGAGDGDALRECERKAAAEKKVEEWLEGVDEDAFGAALEKLVAEKSAAGEYLFENTEDSKRAVASAKDFFLGYSRRIVELSDGRCVYFAPDPRSRFRNADLATCWAEYAFHAVSSGGDKIPGKDYTYRKFNEYKVINTDLIEPTLLAERCVPVLRVKSALDAVKFFGPAHLGGLFDVVVRLDEYGNVNANMTEVTFEASTKRRQKRLPQFVSLTEAIRTVVSHQTATGTYPPNKDSIAESALARKGGERSEKCEVRSEKLGAGERSEKCEVRSEKLGTEKRSEKCEVRSEKLGAGERSEKCEVRSEKLGAGERSEKCGGEGGELFAENWFDVTDPQVVVYKAKGAELSNLGHAQAEDSTPFVDNKLSYFLKCVKGPRTVLFLGRLGEEKGLLNLLDAWHLLQQEQSSTTSHFSLLTSHFPRLVLAGPDWRGYKSKLEAKIAADHIENVEFTGPADEAMKDRLYREADIFVLPSPMENFSMVVLEALAYGVPVIATKGTPWAELESEHCGLWIEQGVEPLKEALSQLLALPTAQLRALGANGRALAARKYQWPAIAEKLLQSAERVVRGERRSEK